MKYIAVHEEDGYHLLFKDEKSLTKYMLELLEEMPLTEIRSNFKIYQIAKEFKTDFECFLKKS